MTKNLRKNMMASYGSTFPGEKYEQNHEWKYEDKYEDKYEEKYDGPIWKHFPRGEI